jgi:hypothetical protein
MRRSRKLISMLTVKSAITTIHQIIIITITITKNNSKIIPSSKN